MERPETMKLNIIGGGNVGKTLGKLWNGNKTFEIGNVLNRSFETSRRAVDFIGSGEAVQDFSQIEPADVFMIAASDDSIAECCSLLCGTGVLRKGNILFHCSGSQSSNLLSQAKEYGVFIASIHPVKSFANASDAVESFQGTFCALEGDPEARILLEEVLQACGAKTFLIDGNSKLIYHAATIFVCNYVVAVIETGLQCYEKTGLAPDIALRIIEPIVRGTVDNIFKLGTVNALTGPIARGEQHMVKKQFEALGHWDTNIQEMYRILGLVLVGLSTKQGTAHPESLLSIKNTLKKTEKISELP